MEIRVSKEDVLWSYLAQFFGIGTGLFSLPAILKMLNADEVGFNYVLLSINSMVVLFDLGFSSQFSRNLTYIFSGAKSIQKEGVDPEYGNEINEKLLATTLISAKRLYAFISIFALLLILSIGTIYVYGITNGFSLFNNLPLIWGLFCLSVFFNLYYLYLNAFLQGRGLVKESKQAQVFSKIVYLGILFTMLFCHCGLMSVVIANLLSPFVFRYIAYRNFFSDDIRLILKENRVSRIDIKETLSILFFNAKKIGIIAVFAALLGYASTLIIASFLPLPIVGSYGVMAQLVGIIGTIANTLLFAKIPELSNYIVKGDIQSLKDTFGVSMFTFYLVNFVGIIGVIILPVLFSLFNFSVVLPSFYILLLYSLIRFLETNQSAYCQLLVVQNKLIYFKSAIWTCIAEFVLLYILLQLHFGLLGVVLAQGIPLLIYCGWKWPYYVCNTLNISLKKDIIQNPSIALFNKIINNNE